MAADELALLQEAGGKRRWLGRRRHGRACKHPLASRHGRPDGGAVGCQVGRGGVAVQGNTECWLGPVTGRTECGA